MMIEVEKKEVAIVANEGLVSLMGQVVTIWCMNYIYSGKLVGVNDRFIKLEQAKVVYETGDLMSGKLKDAQPVPHALYVMIGAIESFMVLEK